MKVEIEEVGPCKKTLKLVIEREAVDEEWAKSLNNLRENVPIPGFRPGRAPLKVIERRFGEDLNEEVKSRLMEQNLRQALDENKLVPLSSPAFDAPDFVPGAEFSFQATLEIRPEFQIKNYKQIAVNRQVGKVDKKLIEAELENLRRRSTPLASVGDEPVAADDLVVAQVEFLLKPLIEAPGDAAPAPESVLKIDRQTLKPSDEKVAGLALPGLKKKLVGRKRDDLVSLELTIPDDFIKADARGKAGLVNLRLLDVRRQELPKLDDEWAKGLGADSLDDLKENLRSQLELMAEEQAEEQVRDQLIDHLVKHHDFPMPEEMIEKWAEKKTQDLENYLRLQGLPEEQIGEQADQSRQASREAAARDLKVFLLLDKIGEEEKIFATETDVEEEIARIAASRREPVPAVREKIEEAGELGLLRSRLREQKVLRFLRESAKVKEKAEKKPKKKSGKG